ncbi:unnamed protein product [Periconia digitata]|uniref:Uncharacterized protein n=1 Tax=Periconia digitata TaxID=1303443 RepID=A0A9W4UNQ9_9PLEO|nr:unnamed protein product [Periconia digitata]
MLHPISPLDVNLVQSVSANFLFATYCTSGTKGNHLTGPPYNSLKTRHATATQQSGSDGNRLRNRTRWCLCTHRAIQTASYMSPCLKLLRLS